MEVKTEQQGDSKFVNEVYLAKFKFGEKKIDGFALVRNGAMLPCPFRTPLVTQTIIEPTSAEVALNPNAQAKIENKTERFFCTSQCPLFQMQQSGSQSVRIDLCCGHGANYKIDKIAPYFEKTEEKKEAKQIKLAPAKERP